MTSANRSLSKLPKLLTAALASLMLFAFGMPMLAQSTAVGNVQVKGLPDDWTHHHLVFSNPGTEEDAVKKNQQERWSKVVNDPRYVIQQLKRGTATQGPAGPEITRIQGIRGDAWQRSIGTGEKTTKIEKDWNTPLGSGSAATTASGTFGAGAPSGTVVVNGLTLTATTGAAGTVLLKRDGTNISGATVTIEGVEYEFESKASSCGGGYNICVYYGTSTATAAQSLEAAINGSSSTCPTVTGGPFTSTCYTAHTTADAPNPSASASLSGSTVTVTDLIANTNLTLAASSTADFTLSGATVTQTASCPTNGTAGNLIIDANSTTQQATNLASAINACNTAYPAVGVTATSATAKVTVSVSGTGGNSIALSDTLSNFSWSPTTISGGSTATVQPNAYPAKYGVSLTAASCLDFAIYPTGQAGGSGAANIIAYDNLYTGGCTGTVPAAYWAYNTGTGESVTTSPIISQDGTQVAFIESNGTTASLVLLKWAAKTGETVNTPLTLTNQLSASAYHTCAPSAATPCMFTIAFANGDDDSISAPFYDYTGDVLYVGDNNGNLHRFTSVLNGAPAEDTTSPWPVALGSNKLASPVYDDTYDAVFVGDLGGTLYCLTTTGPTGSCEGSRKSLGNGWYEASTTPVVGGQIADAPLINSSADYVLAFINSGTPSNANNIYGYGELSFTGGAGSVAVGTGATGHYFYSGAFDNVYYDSTNNTGNLYVVGNTGATTGAILYQVGLSGGNLIGNSAVTAVVTGLTATGANPWPSPLTEFCNNGASPCGAVATQTITGCTINRTTTITCPAGTTFAASLVGATVSGTGIPSGSTISTVPSLTSITISKTTTGNTTITLTVGAAATSPGTDYVFFSVNQGDVGGCTATAGNGCILSYNVTKPVAVAISGTGQNVVTPGTNGCWATGGLSIDNSATNLTGASQIYFVNLAGATAGGGANGQTPTSSACTIGGTPTIDAVQASQANP